MFSKACEYGIRAVLFITVKSLHGDRTRLKEIANEVGAPEAFTAKVLQKLVKDKILCSSTGPKGGFYLNPEEMERIKLIQIVEAIDGDDIFTKCCLGLRKCSTTRPCPVHHKFKKIRMELIEMLTAMNLHELADSVDGNLAFLKY